MFIILTHIIVMLQIIQEYYVTIILNQKDQFQSRLEYTRYNPDFKI